MDVAGSSMQWASGAAGVEIRLVPGLLRAGMGTGPAAETASDKQECNTRRSVVSQVNLGSCDGDITPQHVPAHCLVVTGDLAVKIGDASAGTASHGFETSESCFVFPETPDGFLAIPAALSEPAAASC